MKNVFIGIDFSKEKFDAAIFQEATSFVKDHQIFDNTPIGYDTFVDWIKSQTSKAKAQWLICAENTGLYSFSLTAWLNNKQIDIWLENPLQIKRSFGIARGKNDKVDALRIAMYAYRFRDKAKSTKIKQDILLQIQDLMAYRDRLTGIKTALNNSQKELFKVRQNESTSFISMESRNQVCYINSLLNETQMRIKLLLKKDSLLFDNYKLLTSVKGIGFVNATMVLILTNNFEMFTDPRKFGSYCGVVPFVHNSGTSLRSRSRVSQVANKKMKAWLTEAAKSAVIHDTKLRNYYIKKLQDGKDRALIINNVRNKLVHIMFGVIKNRTPYDPNYANNKKNAA